MNASPVDYARYVWQLVNGFRATHEKALASRRDQDTASYLHGKWPLQVLDLGNGRLRPQYTILKAAEQKVCGIDLANWPRSSFLDTAYRLARWLHNQGLGVSSRMTANQTLVCGDVAALPFRNDSFDLVTSVAALEHFLDVPSVIRELARVIRPGGLVWVCIHLFTCLSGGHNVSFTQIPLRTIPLGVDPWDHLRKRRLPFSVPLNKWRRDQYLEAFAQYFQILKHYCAMREGEEFLTQEIQAELSAYSQDELTCGAYVIVGIRTS